MAGQKEKLIWWEKDEWYMGKMAYEKTLPMRWTRETLEQECSTILVVWSSIHRLLFSVKIFAIWYNFFIQNYFGVRKGNGAHGLCLSLC